MEAVKYMVALILIALAYRVGMIDGLRQNDFDREVANVKIQQCLEIISSRRER